jgi:RNA polymerase sigma-70 factor (ECF subfamily)
MSYSKEQKEVYESLYLHYYPMVLQLCLGYTKGDRELAEDLTQEVFINVWNALSSFKGEALHKTWIYRITVNTCLLYLRDNKKRQTTTLNEVPNGVEHEISDNEQNKYESLYRVIGELPQVERLIMMLLLEELDYSEIAQITGLSSINLRVKMHRIKKKMRVLLTKEH